MVVLPDGKKMRICSVVSTEYDVWQTDRHLTTA